MVLARSTRRTRPTCGSIVRSFLPQGNRQFSFGDYFKAKRPSGVQKIDLVGTSVWVPDDEACYALAKVSEVREDGSVVANYSSGAATVIQVRA